VANQFHFDPCDDQIVLEYCDAELARIERQAKLIRRLREETTEGSREGQIEVLLEIIKQAELDVGSAVMELAGGGSVDGAKD
jgi:hypothetical protein